MKKGFFTLRAGLLGVFLLIICGVSTRANAEVIDIPIEVTFNQTEARKELEYVNAFRTGSEAWYWNEDNTKKIYVNNLKELKYDYNLEKVAMQRAVEAVLRNDSSHKRADGKGFGETYKDFGYVANGYYSENRGEMNGIGSSASSIVESFKETNWGYANEGHRRNMLDSRWTVCAFSIVIYKGYEYYAQEFADPYGNSASFVYTTPNDNTEICYAKAECVEKPFSTNNLVLSPGETKDLTEMPIIVTYYQAGGPGCTPDETEEYISGQVISVTPSDYSVSDKSVATLSGSFLTAKKPGAMTTFTIGFYINGKRYTVTGSILVGNENDYFKYNLLDDNTIEITGVKDSYRLRNEKNAEFIIPSSINGMKVSSIGTYAFRDVDFSDNCIVYISDGIESIGYQAFYRAKMKKIVIPKSVNEFRMNIDKLDFTGTIPFQWLFAEEIEVDKNNSKFASKDGMLFSKDLKFLFVCPERKKEKIIILPLETEYMWTKCLSSSVKYVYYLNPNAKFMYETFYQNNVTVFGTQSAVESWKKEAPSLYFYGDVKFEVYDSNKAPVISNKISLNKSSVELNPDDTFSLKATLSPSNVTYEQIEWSSEKEYVASVDENGVITAKHIGETVITATAWDSGKTTICTVKVIEKKTNSEINEEQVKAFVTRFYTLILNREPEEDGINYWSKILLNKEQTGAQVAYGFVNSPEFTEEHPVNDTEFVKRMYAAFFDRDGGSDGEAWWLGYLNKGYTRNYVLAGFTNSDEFKNLCAQYGIDQGSLPMDESMRTNPQPQPQPHVDGLNIDASNVDPAKLDEYIDRLYRLVLKREPEAEGKQYWREEIIKGNPYNASTAAEIGFFNSPEYLAMNKTDEEFIMDCYLVFLNREAESDGFEYWKEKFRTGEYDRQKLIEVGVGHSNEFKDILRSYGFVIIE